MAKRLSKIYTRTGDDGTTGLGVKGRIGKDSARINAIGTVDELNSHIGVLIAEGVPELIEKILNEVQHRLFDLGGELCMPGHQFIQAEQVAWLEKALDKLNEDLPALEDFILPGGGKAAALCHVARTVCRRAERAVVTLAREEEVEAEARGYLNRLSDLLFVMARVLARRDAGSEVLWQTQREPVDLDG
ncbi:MAG TPA: cob(I)yrinic acid a,c-diamide adenosyltransferase [Gammaproteobacteria bacterium]|jgi:cob(I)alamin adenosyltransferase|nr:cob(I)yrinic acid a,c-diamide adenosyltransferase [Gammaproteobacteria bacterium]